MSESYDMYGRVLRPGDTVLQVSYNRVAPGVIEKFTKSCIIIYTEESRSSGSFIWRNQPYKQHPGQEMILKIDEGHYKELCYLAGKDPKEELLRKNPRIFTNKLVSLEHDS